MSWWRPGCHIANWGVLRPPHVRQELIQFAQRRPADLRQQAPQVSLPVQPVPLGRGEASRAGRGSAPAASLPATSQFLRPIATRLSARSAALVSMFRKPCSA
jgi:hypothetical protein